MSGKLAENNGQARAPAKAPAKEGLVGLLKLKLGSCCTMPSARLQADLHDMALACRTVRNRAARWWQRWREDHPNFDGPGLLPSEAAKERYAAMCLEARSLATVTVASCVKGVDEHLTARMPRNHDGEARYRWQAVLWGEVNLDTSRTLEIPLHNRLVRLCYTGRMCTPATGTVGSQVARFGESSCVLGFQLFSLESGRRERNPIVRLEVGQLSAGNRRVLAQIARGEWPHRDSKLKFREGRRQGEGDWFLHLVYRQPRIDLGLDKARIATLEALPPTAERPFRIGMPGERPWELGFPGLAREHERLERRRASLRRRYREGGSGGYGHGRGRVEAGIAPHSRALQDLRERCVKLVVADVLKFCRTRDCGSLVYVEPSLPIRGQSWFSGRDVCFDWTAFLTRLEHKCQLHGVDVVVQPGAVATLVQSAAAQA